MTYQGLVHRVDNAVVASTASLPSGLDRVCRHWRVGNDLCLVADVGESIARFGDRYLRRLFTEGELTYADTMPERQAERLAGRFAAKEAVIKALRPADARPEWKSIEVVRDPAGWCELHLSGLAADLAAAQGIVSWSVSLSHDSGRASAVVIAGIA